MTDTVKLALISLVGTIVTTAGVALVAYFTYGMKKTTKSTNETVAQASVTARETHEAVVNTSAVVAGIHEQTNGRLLRAEAALAAMTDERDRLLAEAGARRKDDP